MPTRASSSAALSRQRARQHVPVDRPRLGDDVEHGHARVERGKGVLENDLERAAERKQPFRLKRENAIAMKTRVARGRLLEAQEGAREGRLAGAGFADDAQRLGRPNLEAHAIERAHHLPGLPAHQASRDREVLAQVADLEKGRIGPRRPRGLVRAAPGNGGEQPARIVLARRLEYLAHGTAFDDAAPVHDRDPIGDVGDHPEIMRDQQ
jgi:hypothetical protein